MSQHRKVHSHGSIVIPFSWEHSPGISKATHQNQERRSSSLAWSPPPVSTLRSGSQGSGQEWKEKIPPPPGMAAAVPKRSASLKVFLWREDDPFLAAYKECTKSADEPGGDEGKKSNLVKSRWRKKRMSIFSCKSSCDVRENSFVSLSRLPPPLPRDQSSMFR
ncbi:hypothetical protein BT93_C0521 [Corymbia citriodora subsp. variegata]|nr:hypothetical protein BT93_C0521 [Corymbia citriodora subsp. variegata]